MLLGVPMAYDEVLFNGARTYGPLQACTGKYVSSCEMLRDKCYGACERELNVNNFLSCLHSSKRMPPNLSFDGTDFMEGATFNAMRVGYSVIKVSS